VRERRKEEGEDDANFTQRGDLESFAERFIHKLLPSRKAEAYRIMASCEKSIPTPTV
jgi:hypothetical protein